MNKSTMAIALMIAMGVSTVACTKKNIKTADAFSEDSFSSAAVASTNNDAIPEATPIAAATSAVNNAMAKYTQEKNQAAKIHATALAQKATALVSDYQANANQSDTVTDMIEEVDESTELASAEEVVDEVIESEPMQISTSNTYQQPNQKMMVAQASTTAASSSSYYEYDNTNAASAAPVVSKASYVQPTPSVSLPSVSTSSASSSSASTSSYYDYGGGSGVSTTTADQAPVAAPAPASAAKLEGTSGYVIQLIASSIYSKAEALKDEIAGEGYKAFVNRLVVGGKTLYRVQVGPYPSKSQAEKELSNMRSRLSGHSAVGDAFINYNS